LPIIKNVVYATYYVAAATKFTFASETKNIMK
jgi:hypothetical protein